jgi:hypothetical protein
MMAEDRALRSEEADGETVLGRKPGVGKVFEKGSVYNWVKSSTAVG